MDPVDPNVESRRVAVLERDIGNGLETWHYDLQDTENESQAKTLVEEALAVGYPPVVDQNGGGWTVATFLPCLPGEEGCDSDAG